MQSDLQCAVRSLGIQHRKDTYEDAIRFFQSTESGNWLAIFDDATDDDVVCVRRELELPILDRVELATEVDTALALFE